MTPITFSRLNFALTDNEKPDVQVLAFDGRVIYEIPNGGIRAVIKKAVLIAWAALLAAIVATLLGWT